MLRTHSPVRLRPLNRHAIRPMADPWTIPKRCDHWIGLRSSMTREIERIMGAPPRVHRLYEGPDGLSPWEAEILELSPRSRVYAREIALVTSGETAMLARSLTAMDDPVAGVLRRLHRAPLAEVLFSDARWHRAAEPIPLRWTTASARSGMIVGRACLWLRERGRGRVLVEEYFLPPLTARGPA